MREAREMGGVHEGQVGFLGVENIAIEAGRVMTALEMRFVRWKRFR